MSQQPEDSGNSEIESPSRRGALYGLGACHSRRKHALPGRSKARMPYRSLALRADTRERSIVFCGDTAYSRNVVALAHRADLFVCEIIDPVILNEMRERARAAAAAGHPNNIYRHVAETHSSPADVGRMASEAGVKTVVLNHQVPAPRGALSPPVTAFIEGVRQQFSGEVIVGQELMVL